jgi:hypothetical protein
MTIPFVRYSSQDGSIVKRWERLLLLLTRMDMKISSGVLKLQSRDKQFYILIGQEVSQLRCLAEP